MQRLEGRPNEWKQASEGEEEIIGRREGGTCHIAAFTTKGCLSYRLSSLWVSRQRAREQRLTH